MSKLAIIILHKDNNKLLFNCLRSIKDKTKFQDYHIYVTDTGSKQSNLLEIDNFLKNNFTNKATLISFDFYNFAKINNIVVEKYIKDEDLILFCNNDIELIDDCITEGVKIMNEEPSRFGTIGFKLMFEDQTVQHAGQKLFLFKNNSKYEIFFMKTKNKDEMHYGVHHCRFDNNVPAPVLGNTGALMLTSKNLFLKIGKFNELYQGCYEDVEYNIQCLLLNKINLFLPSKAFHFTSQTRNINKDKKNILTKDFFNYLQPFINKHADKLVKLNLSTIIDVSPCLEMIKNMDKDKRKKILEKFGII
jgi:GT2 family glycosyltransferase